MLSGVFNDLGSGSNVDITVITKDKTEVFRGYNQPNERKHPPAVYHFPKGTTGMISSSSHSHPLAILSEKIVPHSKPTTAQSQSDKDEEVPMDTEK